MKTKQKTALNRNSIWKYLVLGCTLLILSLSALPTWYGEKPAVEIRWRDDVALDPAGIKQLLEAQNIKVDSVHQDSRNTRVVLEHPQQQIAAQASLQQELGQGASLALTQQAAAPQWLQSLGLQPMTLGLDLRGGVQFLLDVDMAPVFKLQQDSLLQEIRPMIRGARMERTGAHELVLRNVSSEQTAELRQYLADNARQWQMRSQGDELFLSLDENEIQQLTSLTVAQNLQILRSRIGELGITEAVVQRQGSNRIRVELPGVQDPVQAKEVLGATTSLAFYEVNLGTPNQGKWLPQEDGERVSVMRQPVLTGEHIVDARVGSDDMSRPVVNITLDSEGGRKMSQFTRDRIGYPMATSFTEYSQGADGQSRADTRVISVATIQAQLGRQFMITGSGDLDESRQLALLLRAGSLTAPVVIVEERTIGASLGEENIERGFTALAVGMGLTLVFMGIWYRRLGWVANIALVTNLVLLIGLMALLPGTVLTLPGIAGLVLTVGMAVDTNVLIFERIRDMVKRGYSLAQSIELGFNRATTTIMDANLTSLITAVILYAIGNGPIQGFAITLGLGLLTSMFSGIFLSRTIVNLAWGQDNRRGVKV